MRKRNQNLNTEMIESAGKRYIKSLLVEVSNWFDWLTERRFSTPIIWLGAENLCNPRLLCTLDWKLLYRLYLHFWTTPQWIDKSRRTPPQIRDFLWLTSGKCETELAKHAPYNRENGLKITRGVHVFLIFNKNTLYEPLLPNGFWRRDMWFFQPIA